MLKTLIQNNIAQPALRIRGAAPGTDLIHDLWLVEPADVDTESHLYLPFFLSFFLKINLFIFGCVGSSLLCVGFL